MKKKLFFGVATVFFAVATMFNMNMLQSSNAGDVSLEAIAVMAQAQGESGGSGCPDAPNSDCCTDARGEKYCQHVSEWNHGNCNR